MQDDIALYNTTKKSRTAHIFMVRYKRNEYRKVILPFTVLRRFDCILAPTKDKVLAELPHLYGKSDNIVSESLIRITGVPFYNKSRLEMKTLLEGT